MKFFTDKPSKRSKEKVVDVKTLLKLARQYLDGNNTKKAQQCCRKVLRVNNKSYMAHVLLGKSYGKRADAFPAFQGAIAIKPDHPLAWQGLAHYYELKEDESNNENLLDIYKKILLLDIDEESAIKTLKKYSDMGQLLKKNDIIITLVQFMLTNKNATLKEAAKTEILQLLKLELTYKPEDLNDIILLLKNLNQSDVSDDESELIVLGNLMLQNTDFKTAIEDILALEKFQGSIGMKNWLSKLLCEKFIRYETLDGFDLKTYANQITNGMEYSKYGGILTAITYYMNSMFEEAYGKCVSVVKDNLDVVDEIDAMFMLKCSKMTPNNMRTINLCTYFYKKDYLHNPTFMKIINETFLYCYIKTKDFLKGVYHLTQLPIDNMDSVSISSLGDLYLQFEYNSDTMFQILRASVYREIFQACHHIRNKKYSEAIEILLSYDKHPIKYYYLALSYWYSNGHEESLKYFQKAAELMSDNPKVHYWLGIHYFRQKDKDEESRKCFEKSYALCKTDINVIKMLSIIYIKKGLYDLEFDILKAAYEIPETKVSWLCTRLGNICYHRGKMDEAMKYLEKSLDIDHLDVIPREIIGDIHLSKKDYDLALTAYKKVLELTDQGAIYFRCHNKVGSIYSEQTLYLKAVYVFDNVLDRDPGNVLALKGVTENRVILALKQVAQDSFKNAKDQMQFAMNRIVTAMSFGIKDSAYWSLYADVLMHMTRLPDEFSFLMLESPVGDAKAEKVDLYIMAIETYSNLMKKRDSSALFKIAAAYFEYYCETKDIALCKTSYNLAILYMKVNPNVWPVWDLLGKICFHLNKCETAYFCYSKALSLSEDTEFKLCCDLGLFYLNLDKHQLPSYKHVVNMFDISTFAPTWINEGLSDTCQALPSNDTSEFEDIDTLNVDDVDKLQFTEWIRTFQPSSAEPQQPAYDSPIESFKIVPNSTDIVEWYLCTEEESTWTCCTLGKIKEGKCEFTSAVTYYERAYVLANGSDKIDMLTNKGRVLMKMCEYEKAINLYNGMDDKDLHDTCAIAYALHQMKDYEKSYSFYDKAFNDLCENDEQRVKVLVATSNVVYKLNGVHAATKILLKAAKIKCGEDQDFNESFMNSYIFKRVDIPLVAHVMTEYLFKYMDPTNWWYYMGMNYLRGLKKNSRLTIACIKRAISFNTDREMQGKLYSVVGLALLYSGDQPRALSFITKALKLYNVNPDLWVVFILCVRADKMWRRKAAFLRVVIGTVREFVEMTPILSKWLNKTEEDLRRHN